MSKLIQHPTKQYMDFLSKFEKGDCTFKEFLENLNLAIKKDQALDSLYKAYVKNHRSLVLEKNAVDFFELVTRVRIVDEITGNTQNKSQIDELRKKFQKKIEQCIELEKQCVPKYSFFTPAYCYDDILTNLFSDNNPAIIIGDYLRLMFPNDSDSNICSNNENATNVDRLLILRNNSPYRAFLIRISQDMIEIISDTQLRRIFSACTQIFLGDDNSKIGNKECLQYFKEIFENKAFIPPVILHNLFQYIANDADPHDEFFDRKLLISILELPLKFTQDLKEGQNYISLQYLEGIFTLCSYCIGGFYNQTDTDRILKVVENLKDIQRDELDGYSPVSAYCWTRICDTLIYNTIEGEKFLDKISLTALLACSSAEILPLGWEYYYDENDPTLHNLRLQDYMRLYDRAVEEGYEDLSNAIMAFFLVTQILWFNGRLGNFSMLQSRLKRALSCDRSEMVETALQVTISCVKDKLYDYPQNALTFKLLHQVTNSNTKVIPKSIMENIRARNRHNKVEIIEDLEKWIGSDTLRKLSERAREILIDAEVKWRRSSRDFATGEYMEWGGLALDYCKVFEYEIVGGYEQISKLVEVRSLMKKYNFELPNTGGQVLWQINKLRDDLQDGMEGIGLFRLVGDKHLFREIRKLFTNYRNIAAHTDLFDGEKFMKLRNLIFHERLLSRFIQRVCV